VTGLPNGILVLAFIAGWIVKIRRLARLEVTEDAIRYAQPNGRVSTLSRQQGDETPDPDFADVLFKVRYLAARMP